MHQPTLKDLWLALLSMSKRWGSVLVEKYLTDDFGKTVVITCSFTFSQLDNFKNMIPFDEMTIEDLNHTFPETKLDKVKHPYWPHKPIADL